MSMDLAGVAAAAATPHVWSGASPSMAPTQKMTALFQGIDASGSGSITRAQFDQAFQTQNPPSGFKAMGADAIFNSIAPAGSSTVSKQDFVQGMTSLMARLHAGQHQASNQGHLSQPATVAATQSLTYSLNALNALRPTVSAVPRAATGSTLDVSA
jgi:hypothetical protein